MIYSYELLTRETAIRNEPLDMINDKTRNKWTWVKPNRVIIKRFCYIVSVQKFIVKYIKVLKSFSTGNNHRSARAKSKIDSLFEVKVLTKRKS